MKRRAILPRSHKNQKIDVSDIPEIPPSVFARGLVRKGLKPIERKTQVTLRIDAEVMEWFRARGPGYQTRINSVLKAYKEAHDSV